MTPKQPDYSIIIPNFNGNKFLPNCIKSLKTAIKKCPNSKFEIILVDNNSSDNSIQIFQNLLPKNDKQVIKLSKNFGFPYAVNQGINISKYPYVCILNNDLKIDKNWFKEISQSITKSTKNTACFCGTILNIIGKSVESRGISYKYFGKCIQIKHLPKSAIVWGASAAATVYSKNIIQKIGLFDSSFFAYIEDVDISFRLQKFKYLTICNPMAISYHLGGGTSDQLSNLRQFYSTRNWYLFILKNYTLSQFLQNLIPIFIERSKNYIWFLKSTNIIYWIPHTFLMIFQIIFLTPHIFRQRKLYSNLLKSNK